MPSLLKSCRFLPLRGEIFTLAIGACLATLAAPALAREASVPDGSAAADLSTAIDSQLEATWTASGVTPAVVSCPAGRTLSLLGEATFDCTAQFVGAATPVTISPGTGVAAVSRWHHSRRAWIES